MADAARTISKTSDSAPPSRVRAARPRQAPVARSLQSPAAPGSGSAGSRNAAPPAPSEALVSKVIAVGNASSESARRETRQMAFAKIPGQIVAPIDGGPQPPPSVRSYPSARVDTRPDAPESRRGSAQSTTSKWPPARPSQEGDIQAKEGDIQHGVQEEVVVKAETSESPPPATKLQLVASSSSATKTAATNNTAGNPTSAGVVASDGGANDGGANDGGANDDMAIAMQKGDPSLAWAATDAEFREIDEVRALARRRIAYSVLIVVAALGLIELIALSI